MAIEVGRTRCRAQCWTSICAEVREFDDVGRVRIATDKLVDAGSAARARAPSPCPRPPRQLSEQGEIFVAEFGFTKTDKGSSRADPAKRRRLGAGDCGFGSHG